MVAVCLLLLLAKRTWYLLFLIDCHAYVRVQLTKTLVAAATSEEFLLIKSGLIMFNKLIEVRIDNVLCCARIYSVLCCAVLCRAVLCCALLCCAVLCCAVPCCAVLCCTVQQCSIC